MENNSMSRVLIETVVRGALKAIKNSPERGIRNLVDIALQFSKGRFQQNLFSTVQTMLQNENSAYYELVRDVISHTDTDRLCTFGMNLGYNGCTVGAQRIRESEKRMHCNIPWAVILQIHEECLGNKQMKYLEVIRAGEDLGIYVWMLFTMGHPERVLPFAKDHPDSAFCIFCQASDLTPIFLDEAAELHNIMLFVRYEENESEVYDTLQKMGFLYSAWYQYGKIDTEAIINGDLFDSIQQLKPAFTVLIPEQNCPKGIQDLITQTVRQARSEQTYCTLPWELLGDNSLIDTIISGDACSVCFDKNGDLYNWNRKVECEHHNLFLDSLSEIFMSGCAKKANQLIV